MGALSSWKRETAASLLTHRVRPPHLSAAAPSQPPPPPWFSAYPQAASTRGHSSGPRGTRLRRNTGGALGVSAFSEPRIHTHRPSPGVADPAESPTLTGWGAVAPGSPQEGKRWHKWRQKQRRAAATLHQNDREHPQAACKTPPFQGLQSVKDL